MMNNMSNCINCRKPALMQCEVCKIPYCGNRCQEMNWLRHVWVCRKMPSLEPLNQQLHQTLKEMIPRERGRIAPKPTPNQEQHQTLTLKEMIPRERGPIAHKPTPNQEEQITKRRFNANSIDDNSGTTSRKSSLVTNEEKVIYFPPVNTWLKCVVLGILDNGDVVVCEKEHKDEVEGLSNSIKDYILRNQSQSCQTLEIDDQVAVQVNRKWQRGRVAAINCKAQLVKLVLKDLGTVIKASFSSVFPLSSPDLCEATCYSFRVRSEQRGHMTSGDVVELRIRNKMTNDGSFDVEWKAAPQAPTKHQILEKALQPKTHIKLLRASGDGQRFLAKLVFSGEAKWDHKAIENLDATPEPTQLELSENALVAGHTKEGWQRAVVMQSFVKKTIFLVWLVDEARMTFVDKVRKLPAEFATRPVGVALIMPSNGKEITSLLKEMSLEWEESSRSFKLCTGSDTVAVKVKPFLGDLSQIDLSFWSENVSDGDIVRIVRVVSHCEVFIGAKCTSLYPELLEEVVDQCKTLNPSDPMVVGQLALVKGDNGAYFRGKVISIPPAGAEPLYIVKNVDTGVQVSVGKDKLCHAINAVRALPSIVKKVKLKFLVSVKSEGPSRGLEVLESYCKEGKDDFVLKYDASKEVADLLHLEGNKSLCQEILMLLFQPPLQKQEMKPEIKDEVKSEPQDAVEEKLKVDEKPKEVPPVKAATKKFFLEDIKINQLDIGTRKKLMVLDCSMVKRGVITVAAATDKNVTFGQDLITKVAKHLIENPQMTGYAPELNEVCLVPYSDKLYYRACCIVEKSREMYTFFFIDFGNYENVKASEVLPLPASLAFPTIANVCEVKDLSDSGRAELEKRVDEGRVVFDNCSVEQTDGSLWVKFDGLK